MTLGLVPSWCICWGEGGGRLQAWLHGLKPLGCCWFSSPLLMEVKPKSSCGTPRLLLVLHKSFDAQLGVMFWPPRSWEWGAQCPAFHLRVGWVCEEGVQFGFCFYIPAAHMGIYLLGVFKTFKERQRAGEESTGLCLCGVLNYKIPGLALPLAQGKTKNC